MNNMVYAKVDRIKCRSPNLLATESTKGYI